MTMRRVFQAEPFRSMAMGSLGDAAYMILRQYEFPDTYDDDFDKVIGADHDRVMQRDCEHGSAAIARHGVIGGMGIANWVDRQSPEKVIAFFADLLRADEGVSWTGFRLLGSVHRGNGYPVYSIELFAKHPVSETTVYSGHVAPNVKPRSSMRSDDRGYGWFAP